MVRPFLQEAREDEEGKRQKKEAKQA